MIGLCTALATMSLYWPLDQPMILENPTYIAIKSAIIVAKIMLLETIILSKFQVQSYKANKPHNTLSVIDYNFNNLIQYYVYMYLCYNHFISECFLIKWYRLQMFY